MRKLSVLLMLFLVLNFGVVSAYNGDDKKEDYTSYQVNGKVEVVEDGIPLKGTVELVETETGKSYSTGLTEESTYSLENIEAGHYKFKVKSDQLGSTVYLDELYVEGDTVKNVEEQDFDAEIELTVTIPPGSDELKSTKVAIIDENNYLIKQTYLDFDSDEESLSLSKGIQKGRDYELFVGTPTTENVYIAEKSISTDYAQNEIDVKLESQF